MLLCKIYKSFFLYANNYLESLAIKKCLLLFNSYTQRISDNSLLELRLYIKNRSTKQ